MPEKGYICGIGYPGKNHGSEGWTWNSWRSRDRGMQLLVSLIEDFESMLLRMTDLPDKT
jgi:hypothetical protein